MKVYGDRRSEAPILPTFRLPGADWCRVWCPWCAKFHGHGYEAGAHRAAHCHDSASPFAETGYRMDEAVEVANWTEARPGLAPLSDPFSILAAREPVRQSREAVLRLILPGCEGTHRNEFSAEVGAFIEHEVFGTQSVFVDLDTLSWRYYNGAGGVTKKGAGFPSLLVALFGMNEDAAARWIARLLGVGPAGGRPSADAPDCSSEHP